MKCKDFRKVPIEDLIAYLEGLSLKGKTHVMVQSHEWDLSLEIEPVDGGS